MDVIEKSTKGIGVRHIKQPRGRAHVVFTGLLCKLCLIENLRFSNFPRWPRAAEPRGILLD